MVLGGFRSFHVLVTTSRLNLRYSDVHVECEETAKNYLNGAFLMLTSLQILPVTVLTLESVLCPIKQRCFVQTLRARSLQAQKKWAVAQYRYVIFFPGKALCAVIDGKDLFDFIVCDCLPIVCLVPIFITPQSVNVRSELELQWQ